MDDLDAVIAMAVGADEGSRREALSKLHGRGPGEAAAIVAAWRKEPLGRADRLVPLIVRWPADVVVKIFAPLLGDSAPGVAVGAAAILGSIRHPAAVAPLAEALHLPVMFAAATALGESDCVAGVPPLRDLFGRLVRDARDLATVDERDPSKAQLLAVVVHALGRLGDTTHARWLVDILAGAEDPSARETAAEALREVPVAEALTTLVEALGGPTITLQANALSALWSYRTVEAIDAVVQAQLGEHLLTDGAAMLYDVAAVEVAEDDEWAAIWSSRRARLPLETCLLAGEPITPRALVDRIHAATRVEQALRELELFYGLRSRWNPMLDTPAALLDEIDRWVRDATRSFAPGRMYRLGRDVPDEQLPRA